MSQSVDKNDVNERTNGREIGSDQIYICGGARHKCRVDRDGMSCHVREERHTKRIMSTSISSGGGGSSSTRQPQRSGRRARGMLALVAASGGGDDAVTLPYYPYQPPSARLSDRGRRRRRERLLRGHEGSGDDDLEGGGTCSGGDDDWKQQSALYHPEAFEFTLLYFADSTCRNCLRFNPILARFLEAVNGASGGDGDGDCGTGSADQTLQEGTVAGTALASPTAAATSTHEGQTTTTTAEGGSSSRKVVVQCICVPNDTTEKGADAICRGLGTYCLPFNHENRLALIR